MSCLNHVSKYIPRKSTLLLVILALLAISSQLAQAQYTESVPYTFTGGGDGAYPYVSVIPDGKGNLYGTTGGGGAGCGVVFKLSPPSGGIGPWTETALYTFTCGSDGAAPDARLAFDGKGNLYGATLWGGYLSGCGAYGGCGVVYELSPPSGGSGAWTETVLYAFKDGNDGAVPNAGVVLDAKGNLYGVTSNGGDTSGSNCGGYISGCGVVYELSPPSGGSGPWTENVLYTFAGGSDGAGPSGSLIFDSKGNLYSVALGGTKGYGVAFQLSPPSGGSGPWTQTVLYAFTGGSDGAYPYASLLFDSTGNLYSTTSGGGDVSGSNCGTSGCGVVFRLSPPSGGTGPWTENVLYSFTGGSDGKGKGNPSGYSSNGGPIFDPGGNLYATAGGGAKGYGVAFELTPPSGGTGSWSETVLYTFTDGNDGGYPNAGLVLDSNGNFFGTTFIGGPYCSGEGGCGVVFELSPPVPAVTLTPASLTFGSQLVGTTSSSQQVTMTNSGHATLDIGNIAVSANFGISANTCGATLGVAQSCTVSVTFTPTQAGQLTGTLSFSDNAPNSPQSVSLSGTGIAQVTLAPSSATYKKQKVGTSSKPKKFTLTNNQSVTLTGIAISTTGDFAVSGASCKASLRANKKCSISVTFSPTQTGTRTGQLTVSDSAGNSPQTASLTGSGD